MELSLRDALGAVTKLYEAVTAPVGEKYGLTRAELDILLFLANNPRRDRAADIIGVRRMAKSHVSVSVRSLIAGGYLAGGCRGENRRDIHLVLLEKAGAPVREGRQAQEAFLRILTDGLTDGEILEIKKCAGRSLDNIARYFGEQAE